MKRTALLLAALAAVCLTHASPRAANKFPGDFYFAVSSAAYQVEGGWDADGKGENIWDYMLHKQPNLTADGLNGDVAADSYHKYKEDVQAVVGLNANVYRFSISWSRILPTGDTDNINQAGIDYYNNLIDELLANGIQPMVTLYHFDLPQDLQKLGGWPNIVIADYFLEYARIAFENFGDRVKLWLTLNEPDIFSFGYSTATFPPGANAPGIADYLMAKTVLMAHARVYRLYDQQFRQEQQGRLGITLDCDWYEPLTNSTEDADASDRQLQFTLGMYAQPIFSDSGDFPEVVKQRVADNSRAEGRTRSRLPALTPEEIDYIRGTSDFLGLNHYSTSLITSGSSGTRPSKAYDTGVITSSLEGYPEGKGMMDVPWGLRKLLNWLHNSYPDYQIFITENGWGDATRIVNDTGRIHYIKGYLSAVLRAINEDNVPVIGYSIWSLLDNLQWMDSYTTKFGLYDVDFDDPERTRTARASVSAIGQIYKNKEVPLEDFEEAATTPPA